MFKIFKKKPKDNLEKALEQDLITEEEMLRLKVDRAELIYKEYLEKKHKKRK